MRRFALSVTALALALGCASPRTICDRCNVVLVLVDTLRADHLSSYGYGRQTAPFLDAFAESNIQFLNVRSQSACTFPSVNSLLTSRHIFDFLDHSTRPGIPASIPYLPDILRRRGYATAAVSASPIVRRTPSKHNLVGGFGRGFERFDETCEWRRGSCVTKRATRLLDELEEPFFLYLHYMEPHDPYRPSEAVQGRFAKDYRGPHPFIGRGDPNPIRELIRDGREATIEASDLAHLIDRYDEEILAVDAHLGAFHRQLGERGLLERTIVVFASDHGEAFLEHGIIKHCRGVYEPLTRVPLLLRIPGVEGSIVRGWVENLDVVPTVLDYLGFPRRGTNDGFPRRGTNDEFPRRGTNDGFPRTAADGFAGTSLRRMIEGPRYLRFGPPGRGVARSSMGALRSVNDDRFKLIWRLDSREYLLFDLVSDPAETRNLVRQERAAFRDLLRELRRWIEETEAGVSESDRVRQAEAIEAELRALGYLP